MIDILCFKYVKIVPHSIINSEGELLDFQEECLNLGYEGVVVKAKEGIYKSGKVSSSLKLVKFDEMEVTIKDVVPMEKRPEQGIYLCEWEGKEFLVTPAMSFEKREELLYNKLPYLGKPLTIVHRGFTKYGVPRIAVSKTIRDYE